MKDVLKCNAIPFRWEFPEGISFTYKGKKQRCRDSSDVEKFWRKYRKQIGGKRLLTSGEGGEQAVEEKEDSEEKGQDAD